MDLESTFLTENFPVNYIFKESPVNVILIFSFLYVGGYLLILLQAILSESEHIVMFFSQNEIGFLTGENVSHFQHTHNTHPQGLMLIWFFKYINQQRAKSSYKIIRC